RAVRRQVVRTFEVDRVDADRLGELYQIDDPRGLGPNLGDVLLGHHHVAPFLEFVPLDDLSEWHFALAVRTPALLLNASLAFAMELVEADRGRRIGCRKHPHRNVDQADFHEPFPRRSGGHASSPLSLKRTEQIIGQDGLEAHGSGLMASGLKSANVRKMPQVIRYP